MRFHHCRARTLQGVWKTHHQIIILQIIPTNQQIRTATGHRTARTTAKAHPTVSHIHSSGSSVHIEITRSRKNIQVLHINPVAPHSRSIDCHLTTTQRQHLLRIQIIKWYANPSTWTPGQLYRGSRGLRRHHAQLLNSRVTLTQRSGKSDPLVRSTGTLHRDRSPTWLHCHLTPLINTWLISIIRLPRRCTWTLDYYVSPSRVYLRMIGRTRSHLDSCSGWRWTVSRRTRPRSAASGKGNLATSRVRVSTSTIWRV